ncbi:CrcB family protein [Brachybacterium halotolerans subsp. kimchii]|uniref:fluoride efflux transporter FluC n=1 Tax=Brachybacterium halotolerans TaxID=2795215 RepID=UPI001E506383|nr:CrcB family protein [Brachybacterium halotolerans]UEJ83863.1 CrcB family protein [Brachybacterium halotolerans subsp. kimchii]
MPRPEDPHPEIPLDPDVESPDPQGGTTAPSDTTAQGNTTAPDVLLPARVRPLHLRPSSIALVLIGGTLGTAAREALTLAVPELGGVPIALFAINLAGAFLLGILLEALARSGPDQGVRRALRLCVGTGVMGGFTSYSSLALAVDQLMADGRALVGVAFGLVSVVLGVLFAAAGILAASRRTSRRPHEEAAR